MQKILLQSLTIDDDVICPTPQVQTGCKNSLVDIGLSKKVVNANVAGQKQRAPIAVNRLGCTTSSER